MQRSECQALDAKDLLAFLRQQFYLPEGIIYLDGNSLGPLPVTTAIRLAAVLEQEWGKGLIRSWNTAGWITLAQRVGEKIAKLIGAGSDEVIATDSTSVNLFKVLAVALRIAQQESKRRTEIISEAGNFPTDLYIAQGLTDLLGGSVTLRMVEREQILSALNERTAVVMLTHVNYKTGQLWDMGQVTQAAHEAGALMVWDLAHSAGALPVELKAVNADFAVGCGYKYLNGGPGAPAFVWVHPRHMHQGGQPLSGWLGHATPFAFTAEYRPAPGIHRYLCGTPPILSLTALDCGVDSVLAAQIVGGMKALRNKSEQLTQLFIELVEQHCGKYGLKLVSPRQLAQRGSQVSFSHEHAYPIMQALIERGVIGDFRAPDILRFGFAPLYTRFVDVWDAVQHLIQVLQLEEWQQSRFAQRNAVT
ncbi:MAG: kynureninase [Burkholderiaceae bacterium]|nr:kynureninase [Burkholderiaceae bacterium]